MDADEEGSENDERAPDSSRVTFEGDPRSLPSTLPTASAAAVAITEEEERRRRHHHPERFVGAVLTAFQDATAEVYCEMIRADLLLSFVLLLGAVALLSMASSMVDVAATTTFRNAYGDRDVPCSTTTTDAVCYRRVDRTGRVLYVRNASGVHFEMHPQCSRNAPETRETKCTAEWAFVEPVEQVDGRRAAWYFRLYENLGVPEEDRGRLSFVSVAVLLDDAGRPTTKGPVFRTIFRRDGTARWIASATSDLPGDAHAEEEEDDADFFFDGAVTFGAVTIDDYDHYGPAVADPASPIA